MTNRPLFISDDSDSIYHHGVKGQKLGVLKRLKNAISAHNARAQEIKRQFKDAGWG